MKTILVVHGPNLNRLGARDAAHYGSATLADLERVAADEAIKNGCAVTTFQSNHEGALIDFLQKESGHAAGIVINPGALTHYSYALHDALVDTRLPVVEVHLSNIEEREEWRAISVIRPACIATITGKKEEGYREAVQLLAKKIAA